MASGYVKLTTPRSMPSALSLQPDVPLCQSDLPLDRYDEAFRPYAESYLALPDRKAETILPWLDAYVLPAIDHFGNDLLLLAHFYMGGEIVKLVERYGGLVADSYALALEARQRSGASIIVESAVHFMAETAAILAREDQTVWITNPRAGCTMEMMAQAPRVLPIAAQLRARFGADITALSYMNTSGQLKALAGAWGGAVCTSSNAHLIMAQLMRERPGAKVLFLPDEHLGRNTAARLGIQPDEVLRLPDATSLPADWTIDELDSASLERAKVLLWGGWCGVHTVFNVDQVRWWRERGWRVHVHPECPLKVVQAADGSGSTNYLWSLVEDAPAGSRLAIATEGHFVRNAREAAQRRGVEVVHLADIPGTPAPGCGCATMSRNDPPHLAGMLDLLRKGEAPEYHRVLPGDSIDTSTGTLHRMPETDRQACAADARLALERMIEITEAAS
ncbi:MAG: quinolinate synthase NadA [Phycisphaerales bacterium]|nr:quinolinate synthase NadA [Phycisphaerales bacterium]